MKNSKHLFFDLDHTLWDFKKNSREAILQLFIKDHVAIMCKVDFESFISVYETINEELWVLYGLKKTTKEELRYQRFYQTFLHFNYDAIDLAYRWAEDYLMISPYKTHLIEGALEILDYLKDKYTLHIITNGFKEVQHIKLDASHLKPFFKHIIISEEHQLYKPDIKIFELALSLSKSIHSECIMIGDSYEADILGALNAGWKAIYLSDQKKENTHENFIQIEKLSQLKSIL